MARRDLSDGIDDAFAQRTSSLNEISMLKRDLASLGEVKQSLETELEGLKAEIEARDNNLQGSEKAIQIQDDMNKELHEKLAEALDSKFVAEHQLESCSEELENAVANVMEKDELLRISAQEAAVLQEKLSAALDERSCPKCQELSLQIGEQGIAAGSCLVRCAFSVGSHDNAAYASIMNGLWELDTKRSTGSEQNWGAELHISGSCGEFSLDGSQIGTYHFEDLEDPAAGVVGRLR